MTSPRPLPDPGRGAEAADPATEPAAQILTESGRCVACGLCVPKCPTYRKTLSEADSPRGRIALIRGAVEGRIPANERLHEHLDLCLNCRACEAVCPNGVAYGPLYDLARGLPGIGSGAAARSAVPSRGWFSPLALRTAGTLLRLYQRSGAQRLVRGTKLLRKSGLARAEAFLPPLPDAVCFRANYPAVGNPVGEVALFLGCVARIVDTDALQAAIYVLTHLGYSVHVPAEQNCCGALHAHAGDGQSARVLWQANERAFAAFRELPIVTLVSGCGARLLDYGAHYGEAGRAVARRVVDAAAFLAQAPGWARVQCAPLRARAAVHEPCTLRNVMRAGGAAQRLLAYIPDLSIESLAGNDQCCGAAGVYFLSQPEMAEALRADKLAAVAAMSPEFLITSNIGCALFLGEALRSAGSSIQVLHPVTLVARQLGFKGVLP
ncbi:MAG: (Fe-S)-binding protein [Burkholderiales bacterium]